MKRPRVYDVTMSIREGMPAWPGDPAVALTRIRSMEDGDPLNLSNLSMSAHTGTHVDSPRHFFRKGAGVETLPLEALLGPAQVLEVPGSIQIGPTDLEAAGLCPGVERILLKTDNQDLVEREDFEPSYAHLTADGARRLAGMGVKLVGIDYLSIAPYGTGEEVHRLLLTASVVVLEGLDLRGVPAGPYDLVALPLKIEGCDGAPARVLLLPMGTLTGI